MSEQIFSSQSHYSSEVSMYLQLEDRCIDLAGCLENRCTLREPTSLNPCEADLVIVVDGQEYRQRVAFPSGVNCSSPFADFIPIDRHGKSKADNFWDQVTRSLRSLMSYFKLPFVLSR
jgi:hypothetical protein